jgi:formate-dependent nitrite reductase membrane component NrfD
VTSPDGARPGARTRRARRADDRRAVAPKAQFGSYYGRPVLKEPVWRAPEIPGYLFLGGLAGASSLLAAGAQATGNRDLARAAKTGAATAIGLGGVALYVDLGRPARFLNMLRVFKVTSPMSVGSWLLATYGPAAAVAAACAVTGRLPRLGAAASALAAALGAGVATYTAALVADTAVPAWHDGHRELPYLFAGSAAAAAGGLGMLTTRPSAAAPAIRLAILGGAAELTAKRLLLRRLGAAGARPYRSGRAARLMVTSNVLTVAGISGAALARGSRPATAVAGLALLGSSALTRFGVFMAGRAAARDPAYTVGPQRQRLAAADQADADARPAVPAPR